MADQQHSTITDPHVHEPKGASTAANATVYVSNGAGSGTWKILGVENVDYPALRTGLQADLNAGTLVINGRYWLTTRLTDVSTPSSVIIPVPRNSVFHSATLVLGGPITDANSIVSFTNSAGAGMGTPVTVAFTASAKGNQYTFTATGNNTITGPSWVEIVTDGGSTGVQPLYITVELSTILNP